MAAKRQVAFALSLLPPALQPVEVITKLIEDHSRSPVIQLHIQIYNDIYIILYMIIQYNLI